MTEDPYQEVNGVLVRRGRPPLTVIASVQWGRETAHELQELLFGYRKTLKVPIVQMSEAMGVTDSIVHRLERNERDARLSTVLRYAKCLGLDLELVEKEKAIA